VTIGLFKVIETIGQALANNLTKVLDYMDWKKKHCLCEK
jgi:hypothetical protein